MDKDKYINPEYKPDEHTCKEIENLHKKGESLSGIQLKFADMKNANLINADLSNSDLTKADFSGASMYGVNLEGANLFKTNLEGANLKAANMKNCNMLGADFSNTKLNSVEWSTDYKIINEQEAEAVLAEGNPEKAKEKYKEAEDIYRALKISLKAQTLGDDVGKFFEREMIVRRKQMPRFSPRRIIYKLAHLTTGYGEKIGNIFYTAIWIIIACALLYGIEGVSYLVFQDSHLNREDLTLGFFGDVDEFGGMLNVIGNLLYFSVVVFSTVGFGDIVPIGLLGKSIMVFEGIIGGLIMAVLIIALYKQLMDR